MSKPHPAPTLGVTPDPVDELTACQKAIRDAGWWTRSPLTEHWPLTTGEAVLLLGGAGEFDVDEAGLEDLIGRRLLPAPVQADEDYEWSAVDLIRAGGLLEMREQWSPTPSGHDAKKHPCQLLLEQARQDGQLEQIVRPDGNPHLDLRHCLALLARCETAVGRVKIIALLKAILEVDHGVYVP